MGTNAWGTVFTPTSAPWESYIAQACGLSTVSTESASGIAGAVGSEPSSVSVSDTSVPSSTPSSSSNNSDNGDNPDDGDVSTDGGIVSSSISVTQTTTTTQKVHTAATPVVTEFPDPTSSKSSTSKQPQQTISTTTSTSKTPTSTSSSSGSSGGTSSSDINAYLKGHNDARAKHGAKPLTWSDNLASKAQKWANGCVFQHSGGSLGSFGENLAAGTGKYGIDSAIQSWVIEDKNYDPNNPQASHFTQVVWKSTTKVGCAVQSCNGIFDASFGKARFYVCEYDPPGNFNNLFEENVQV